LAGKGLTNVLRAKGFAVGASGSHQDLAGPTRKRAIPHQRESDLYADGGTMLMEICDARIVSSRAGRPPAGVELAMTTR